MKWRFCREVENEHQENQRQYAHTFHYPNTICVCKAFWDLPKSYRDGVLLHEIGHLLAGPEGSEREATEAAEELFQVPIEYADSPYGRDLERVMNGHGVGIVNRRRVLFNPIANPIKPGFQRVTGAWYRIPVGDGYWYHLKKESGQWDIYSSDSEYSFERRDYTGFEFTLQEAKDNVLRRLSQSR